MVSTKEVRSSPNTSGLTDLVSVSDQSAEPSMLKLTVLPISLTGITMVHLATKPSQKTLRLSLSPAHTTVTPSDKETTSWSCAKPGNGLMPTSKSSAPQTQTSVILPPKSGMPAVKKYHGTESNKSTPCSEPQQNSPHGLLDGLTMVTLVNKDLTIAQ